VTLDSRTHACSACLATLTARLVSAAASHGRGAGRRSSDAEPPVRPLLGLLPASSL
jgi:hypothetical protein